MPRLKKKEFLEKEPPKIQAMERVPAISEHEIMKVLNKKKDLLLSASDANKKKVWTSVNRMDTKNREN